MTDDEKLFLMLKLLLEPIEVTPHTQKVDCSCSKKRRIESSIKNYDDIVDLSRNKLKYNEWSKPAQLDSVKSKETGEIYGAIGSCQRCGKVYYWIEPSGTGRLEEK